jgi:hypothetical protein
MRANGLTTWISYALLFTISWSLFLIVVMLTLSLGSQVPLIIVLFVLPAGEFLLGIKGKELLGKITGVPA